MADDHSNNHNNFTDLDYDEYAGSHPTDPSNIMGLMGALLVVVMIVVGTVGNLMVLVGVLLFERLHKSYNVFIASLSLTDLLFNVLIMPFFADSYLHRTWRFDNRFCQFHAFFGTVLIMCSSLHISLIAINRYILVVHPPFYPNISTPRLLFLQIFIVWLVSTASVFPGALGWHAEVRYTDQISRCTYVRSKSRESLDIVFSLGFVLPCCVVMLCYGLIVYRSKQSEHKVKSHKVVPPHPANTGVCQRLLFKSDHYMRLFSKHHMRQQRRHSYECMSTKTTKQAIPLISVEAEKPKHLDDCQEMVSIPCRMEQVHEDSAERASRLCNHKTNRMQRTLFASFRICNKKQRNNSHKMNHKTSTETKKALFEVLPRTAIGQEDTEKRKISQKGTTKVKAEVNQSEEIGSDELLVNWNNKEGEDDKTKVIKSFARPETNEIVEKNVRARSSCPEFGSCVSAHGMKKEFFCFQANKPCEILIEKAIQSARGCNEGFILHNHEKLGLLVYSTNGIHDLRANQQTLVSHFKKSKQFIKDEITQEKYCKHKNCHSFRGYFVSSKASLACECAFVASSDLASNQKVTDTKEYEFKENDNIRNSKKHSNEEKTLRVFQGRNLPAMKLLKGVEVRKLLSPNDCRNLVTSERSSSSHLTSVSSASLFPSREAGKKAHRRRSSMKMILVIFLAFALTYLPFTVLNLADEKGQWSRNWYMVTSLAFWAGSCTNPIIYGVLNNHFRRSYCDIIHLLASLFRRKNQATFT